ncbi:uncharacterized protein LOC144166348 [Haemaphysalis longicornis]
MTLSTVSSLFMLVITFGHGTNVSNAASDTCDFSGLDYDLMVNDVLSHLPVTYAEHEAAEDPVISGVFSRTIVYTGLEKLRPRGAVVSYCRNGSRLVQVDLATGDGEEIKAQVAWKICAGLNGTLGSTAGARATVIFEVVNPSSIYSRAKGPTLTHHSGPIPVFLDPVSMFLDGAGETAGQLVNIAGKLFPQLAREFWLYVMTTKVSSILQVVSLA